MKIIDWFFGRNGVLPTPGRPGATPLARRQRRSLRALRRAGERMERLIEDQKSRLEEMESRLEREREQYEFTLDEAQTTIRKYEVEVDALRDQVSVNEQTIQYLQTSNDLALQQQREQLQASVNREVGSRGRQDDSII